MIKIKFSKDQHLAFIVHAQMCEGEKLGHCKKIKDIIQHVSNCKSTALCTEQLCTSTKKLKDHWGNCVDKNCTLCIPIKMLLREANRQ